MSIKKSTHSAPANDAEKFMRARSFGELPENVKAALQDLKVGETATFILPDECDPSRECEYKLTKTDSVVLSNEEYERLVRDEQAAAAINEDT